MLKLGEKQNLEIIKRVDFGVYLAESQTTEERVLLPAKQVPEDCRIGDRLDVFLYKDSKDRLIATTNEPKLVMGQLAKLRVAEAGNYGAFLDWGLEKDLLLPFKEQTYRVKEGDQVLVTLYEDRSSRLCATMKIDAYLSLRHPYVIGDQVKGTIYETNERFGAFVAVDDKYSGLIPLKEWYGDYLPGEEVEARVAAVKEDGKMDLSVRKKAYLQMDEDAGIILKALQEHGGSLPYHDKTSPEIIKREFHLSKNAFKRAIGRLFKDGKIEITDNGIRLK